MIGYSILNVAINDLISRGIVQKVYHSVDIWNKNGERFPGYRQGDEWIYVGVNDTKIMNAYIREISSFKTDKVEKITSTLKKYIGSVTLRLVVFNDFETRNHDDLLVDILNFTFMPHITLKRVISNNDELLKEEATVKNFTFGATTFYKAIDFTMNIQLVGNNCQQSIGCDNWQNPITAENIRDFSDDFS